MVTAKGKAAAGSRSPGKSFQERVQLGLRTSEYAAFKLLFHRRAAT